jgi:hypothetical protein
LTGRRMDGTKRGCGFGGTTSTRKVLDSGRLNFLEVRWPTRH